MSTENAVTWTADNGDGTYTNPLFYEEFSDPDIIRVGDTFFMTGTTMHTMPGLPVLQSTDLVNWELLTYACDVLDLGPEFRLEGGEIYGQGIWAPCLRYKNGTFYIFTNVNKQRTQLFTATDPRGPWTRTATEYALHDLSVLFDDDGRNWVVWGYQNLKLAELDQSLTRIIPGSERDLFPAGSDIGEGVHFYKINGQYLLTSAWFAGRMRMPGARAMSLDGPWELNPALSFDEDFGLREGYRMVRGHLPFTAEPPFELIEPNDVDGGRLALHQGGIVDTEDGQWWGWSMMDYNSIGRLTCLSPVTWRDGWPYFGLPGNLGRTPRTWTKPNVARPSAPRALFERNDDFDGSSLKPIWQWNHVPSTEHWSLTERPGYLRLHTLPASSFWDARNSLTQRAVGPMSTVTAKLDGAGLGTGDVAGLGLLGLPWCWVGLRHANGGWQVQMLDQQTGHTDSAESASPIVWLRAQCDFLAETAQLSWSADGTVFEPLGAPVTMVFQLKTFQGIRYALFAYGNGGEAGFADFDSLTVDEPYPRGLTQPIPLGKTIDLVPHGRAEAHGLTAGLLVVDAGLGRVTLQRGEEHLAVEGDSRVVMSTAPVGDAARWQWMETPYGDVILMSLATNRFLRLADDGALHADSPGPSPTGRDGALWAVMTRERG